MKFTPFGKTDSLNNFAKRLGKAKADIDAIDNVKFLEMHISSLEEQFISAARIKPLVLREDKIETTTRPTKIKVKDSFRRLPRPGMSSEVEGEEMVIIIPFDGDETLWSVQPSTHFLSSAFPEVSVSAGLASFSVKYRLDEVREPIVEKIRDIIVCINKSVAYLAVDIERHNANVPREIREYLEKKRGNAIRARELATSLGITLKSREEPGVWQRFATKWAIRSRTCDST